MNIYEATEILTYHQQWRLGNEDEMKYTPKELTQAIDIVLKYSNTIKEIENAMERWHLGRDNDDETLENINQSLVDIGLLGWFNRPTP